MAIWESFIRKLSESWHGTWTERWFEYIIKMPAQLDIKMEYKIEGYASSMAEAMQEVERFPSALGYTITEHRTRILKEK